MRLRTGIAAALCGLMPAAAAAASISMNEVELASGATMADCKTAGLAALAHSELRPMPEAPAAVFGEGPNGLIVAVYCLPERGIAVVGVAGESSGETQPALARVLGAFGSD